jgi:lysophospholipase L1-like esterase
MGAGKARYRGPGHQTAVYRGPGPDRGPTHSDPSPAPVWAQSSPSLTPVVTPVRPLSDTTIVALGDSTTAGTPGFKSPIEAPPDGSGDETSQYAYWLMQTRPSWHVLNHGVNGERSDQIRARFARDVVTAAPRAVVVIAGVNDIYQGRSAAVVERELEAIYVAARAARIPVVAGSIIPYNTATVDANARMHEVNDWIAGYAAAHPGEVVFCDTRAAVAAGGAPDCLASSPDGLHPSADGYRRMAAVIEPAVAQALTLG